MLTELRVLIAVPTAGMVPIGFTYSLMNLTRYHSAQPFVATRREAKTAINFEVRQSSCIHSNREKLAASALADNQTHLMFLDDDMAFDMKVLEIMLGRRQPVVVTNYLIKGQEPEFVAIGLDGKRVATTEASTGMFPILYSGFGVSLFETDVFRKTPQPWFQPDFDPEENAYTTEDFSFFNRVHEAGFDVMLDQDASKLVGHIGRKTWQWNEWKPKPLEIVGGKDGEQKSA